jgi:flagellar assembly factor FliW
LVHRKFIRLVVVLVITRYFTVIYVLGVNTTALGFIVVIPFLVTKLCINSDAAL